MKKLLSPLVVILLFGLSGCFYDNEEDLYVIIDPPACDTLNVSYAMTIIPLLETNCYGCHSGSTPSGNINLTDFTKVEMLAQNGRLYGSIAHEPGWSPMPKNENKLQDCELAKVKSWVDAGAPNN